MEYAENGTDPVATYTGIDPEGRPIYWSLLPADTETTDIEGIDDADDADFEHFMISSDGILTFKLSPDYETPEGLASDNGTTNTYKVVVVASDDAPGSGDMINVDYHGVTVIVTDVDEGGSISPVGAAAPGRRSTHRHFNRSRCP